MAVLKVRIRDFSGPIWFFGQGETQLPILKPTGRSVFAKTCKLLHWEGNTVDTQLWKFAREMGNRFPQEN